MARNLHCAERGLAVVKCLNPACFLPARRTSDRLYGFCNSLSRAGSERRRRLKKRGDASQQKQPRLDQISCVRIVFFTPTHAEKSRMGDGERGRSEDQTEGTITGILSCHLVSAASCSVPALYFATAVTFYFTNLPDVCSVEKPDHLISVWFVFVVGNKRLMHTFCHNFPKPTKLPLCTAETPHCFYPPDLA